MLLVLDNFEHLLAAAAIVSELVNAASGLTILITSRTLLRVAGEQEFPLTPLAVPEEGRLLPPEALFGYGAVALFVERALAAQPDFELTTANAQSVVEICRRLDGLPLAIELAAARLRLLTPESLLNRLDARLGLLTRVARDRQPHQQGLRETIQWSVDLLAPPEQLLFAQLSVFAGGFWLEAAEAVCGKGGSSAVVEGVEMLLENSLLRRTGTTESEPRFAMLSTIRDFALERLEESGQSDDLRRRHAEHFAGRVEGAEPEMVEGRPGSAGRLAADHDNIRAALAWAIEAGRYSLALRLATPLARFWRDQGFLREGTRWLEAALAGADDQPADIRGKALRRLYGLYVSLGDAEAGQGPGEEALAIAREHRDHQGIAECLLLLGLAASDRGEYARGASLFREAAENYRAAGNQRGAAYATGNLGYYSVVAGDAATAVPLFEEALAVLRPLGDDAGEAWVLENLALIALRDGRVDDAARFLSTSLALSRRWEMQDEVAANGLIDAAAIATQKEAFQLAARLIGAVDAWREAAGVVPSGSLYETALREASDAARQALGDAEWDSAFSEGRGLRFMDAVDEALGLLEGWRCA